ncbi:MAG: flagellin [Planctomycetota bacterium]
MIAQRVLNFQNKSLVVNLERLSTGLRINRGKDDPAGLIASENLRAEKRAIDSAISNAERAEQVVNVAWPPAPTKPAYPRRKRTRTSCRSTPSSRRSTAWPTTRASRARSCSMGASTTPRKAWRRRLPTWASTRRGFPTARR